MMDWRLGIGAGLVVTGASAVLARGVLTVGGRTDAMAVSDSSARIHSHHQATTSLLNAA